VRAIGVGTAHVTFTRDGDEFLAPATPVAVTVHVLPAPLVTVLSASKFYGSPTPVFGFVFDGLANGDNPDALQPLSVDTTIDETTPAGTYSIRARTAHTPNYVFTYPSSDFVVVPAPLAVTADDRTRCTGTLRRRSRSRIAERRT
jgi:hypothetical protein